MRKIQLCFDVAQCIPKADTDVKGCDNGIENVARDLCFLQSSFGSHYVLGAGIEVCSDIWSHQLLSSKLPAQLPADCSRIYSSIQKLLRNHVSSV